MDEKEIILQCRQGNLNAFARLVDHFQYRVIAVACNITGDPEEARDVAQDTFVQAFINLDTFDLTPMVQNPKTRMIEDSLILRDLLKKLNTKERSILALQINEGFSARELGNIFNCSENTIRVHLFRARQKLKRVLGNNPDILGKKEVVK